MAVSRSALEYLRRRGLVHEDIRPRPRQNFTDLLVHTVPLDSPPAPSQPVLRSYEQGAVAGYAQLVEQEPPDRGGTRPWPGQPATGETE